MHGDPVPPAVTATGIDLHTRGGTGPDACGQISAAIGKVLARHGIAAAGVRIRLAGSNCGHGPALAQVNLRINGNAARIQVPGRTQAAAIATAAIRLERQIRRVRTGTPVRLWPDVDRRALAVACHGDLDRVKPVRSHLHFPAQAIGVLDAMDYDVHLFTDAETGEDTIIYRAGPTGLRLARQDSMDPPTGPTPALTISPRRVPVLTPQAAAIRLTDAGLAFVFFTNPDSQRGNLLYRRYDGDLGLVHPV